MFIIAEIGQAHDGSLGIAHSFIDALADTGVDAVKFQMHIADAESSVHEPFRVNFSYQDKTRMDYWRRMEFSFDQWVELARHCQERNLEFMASPFSIEAVHYLNQLGVNKFKIGSGEVNNLLALEWMSRYKKYLILSSGMSSFAELNQTVAFLKEREVDFSILQCTTSYPSSPENWGLNVIQELKARYGVPVGFSDHSGDIYACLAAAALGAEILEFHVTFDKMMFGPDAKSSLTIEETKRLVQGLHQVETAHDSPINKNDASAYTELKKVFEKSLAVNKDLPDGHIITINDLEAKKPKGLGINANNFQEVIDKKLRSNKKKWDFLRYEDINE